MGYPVYIEWGVDCNVICAGAVRLFPVGETPKWAYVRFSGPRLCDIPACAGLPNPPNDSYFHLEQDPADSCRWEFDDGLWNIEWSPGKPADQHSYLNLTHVPSGKNYFLTTPNSLGTCVVVFANHGVCGPNKCAFGGTGEMAFAMEPYKFLVTYGFCPVENFYAAMSVHKPAGRMYILKNRVTSTRLTFLVED